MAKDVETDEDIYGGGYGYVGRGRPASNSPELTALFNELDVARIYFPREYRLLLCALFIAGVGIQRQVIFSATKSF